MKNIIFVLIFILCANYIFAESFRNLLNEADSFYDKKDYKKSAEYYDNASKLAESKDIFYKLKYNEAVSLYKAGDYKKAAETFKKVLESEDLNLQQKSYYNLGNSLIKIIKKSKHSPETSKMLDNAIRCYKNAILLNQNDNNAKRNYEIALKMKKQMQKNKSENQRNKNNKQNKDKNQNKDKKQSKENKNKNEQKKKEDNKDKNNQGKEKDKKQQNNRKKDENKKNQNKTDKKSEGKQDKKDLKIDKKKLSREEMERILKAMEDEEKANRKRVKVYTGQEIKTDRDW